MTLRIAQVSTFDTSGGAARSAYRLHRGLIEKGHECRMLVSRGDSGDPTVEVVPACDGGLHGKIRQRLRRRKIRGDLAPYRSTRPEWPERFSDDRSRWDWQRTARLDFLDVINLHWVAGFVDYGEFFRAVPPHVKVVWTLRDMNIFTGGCHYDAGCDSYVAQCGACPQLGSTDGEDLSRQVWNRKRELFETLDERRLHIVTPSRWMADEVRSSSLLGDRFAVSAIPNGVNTDEFAPRDRAAARATLGLPQDSLVRTFRYRSCTSERWLRTGSFPWRTARRIFMSSPRCRTTFHRRFWRPWRVARPSSASTLAAYRKWCSPGGPGRWVRWETCLLWP